MDKRAMPKGGWDVKDLPSKKKDTKGKEFVDATGGDYGMHALILGDDDQFVTEIPVIKPKT